MRAERNNSPLVMGTASKQKRNSWHCGRGEGREGSKSVELSEDLMETEKDDTVADGVGILSLCMNAKQPEKRAGKNKSINIRRKLRNVVMKLKLAQQENLGEKKASASTNRHVCLVG